jgi:hypothetical protein
LNFPLALPLAEYGFLKFITTNKYGDI